jgi:hypothetical protein
MKIRRYSLVLAFVIVAYPALYAGARASHLLVRTLENSDPRYSNNIIPGRGIIQFFLGETSWYFFCPARKCETWYRNRPEYKYWSHRQRVESAFGYAPVLLNGLLWAALTVWGFRRFRRRKKIVEQTVAD